MSRESVSQQEVADTEPNERGCPECGSDDVAATDANERICKECGLVLEEDLIDRGPEWRAYSHRENEEKSRVGTSVTHRLHDKGLTTEIGWEAAPGSGEQRQQLNRIRKWQKRIQIRGSRESNLSYALGEIDRMASALGVPKSVREVAAVTYRRVQEDDLVLGWSHESMASAVLYVACRQEGIPRSLDEVLVVSRVDDGIKLGRAYRHLLQELDLEMEPVDPKAFLPRFCSELGLDEAVQSKAREIINKSIEQGLLSGKSPSGFAAAAIYAAARLCDADCTQNEISKVAQVSDVTIRTRYKEQLEALAISIDTGGDK